MSGVLRAVALLGVAIVALAASGCSGDDDGAAEPTAAPAANEWTMLASGPRSHFRNEVESRIDTSTASTMREAWEFQVTGSVPGTPAIVDGRVYALATVGGLYALDAATGAEIWRNGDVRGTSSPTYSDGKLYVNDSSAVLHRLDAGTGAEDWQAAIDPHEYAFGFSSPVVAGELVIVGSASTEEAVVAENATFRGGMVAFDASTGAEVWRHYTADPPYNGVAMWSSPSVDDELGLVYGTTGNNYTGDAGPSSDSVFALEVSTGEVRWIRQLSEGDVFTILNPRSPDSDFGTNPVLFEATIDGRERRLLGAGQKSGMFWVLDRESGEVVWSRQVSGGSALIGGVFNNGAFDGERLIVAGNNGTSSGPGSETSNGRSRPLGGANVTTSVLMAMEPATGDVLWERQLPAWVWAPITVANGVGFVSADNQLQAFNTATGERLFTFDTAGTIASGAAIADGRIVFGSGISYLGTTAGDKVHALSVP